MKYSMNNAQNFEIISWWKREIWIFFWKWYQEKKAIYSYYLSMYIWPFLRKFWLNPEDSNWDEQYLVFQSILLNSWYYKDWNKELLSKEWFEIVWIKEIQLKFDSEKVKQYLEKSWDDFDMLEYLQKAYSWEYYFWLIPWENNSNFVIFAKKVKVEVGFTSWLQEIVDVSTLWIDECLAMIDCKNLSPEIRDLRL